MVKKQVLIGKNYQLINQPESEGIKSHFKPDFRRLGAVGKRLTLIRNREKDRKKKKEREREREDNLIHKTLQQGIHSQTPLG